MKILHIAVYDAANDHLDVPFTTNHPYLEEIKSSLISKAIFDERLNHGITHLTIEDACCYFRKYQGKVFIFISNDTVHFALHTIFDEIIRKEGLKQSCTWCDWIQSIEEAYKRTIENDEFTKKARVIVEDIEAAKEVMQSNVEKLCQREARLQSLLARTDHLSACSISFKKHLIEILEKHQPVPVKISRFFHNIFEPADAVSETITHGTSAGIPVR